MHPRWLFQLKKLGFFHLGRTLSYKFAELMSLESSENFDQYALGRRISKQ